MPRYLVWGTRLSAVLGLICATIIVTDYLDGGADLGPAYYYMFSSVLIILVQIVMITIFFTGHTHRLGRQRGAWLRLFSPLIVLVSLVAIARTALAVANIQ